MRKRYITKESVKRLLEMDDWYWVYRELEDWDDKSLSRLYRVMVGIEWLDSTGTGILTLDKEAENHLLIPREYKTDYDGIVETIKSVFRDRALELLLKNNVLGNEDYEI